MRVKRECPRAIKTVNTFDGLNSRTCRIVKKKKKKTLNTVIIELAEICNMDINATNNKDFYNIAINRKLLEHKNLRSKAPPLTLIRIRKKN